MKTAALAALVLAAASASAQDATLVKFSGPVSIVADGGAKAVAAKGGEELIYGDKIKVGKGGVAQLALKDRGAVLLREESEMTLAGSNQATLLNFKFGEFLIGLSKALERRQNFKVRTPSAVAAVRGTLFWGKADKATKATTYAGLGHRIAVSAKGKTVEVAAGQTVTVAFGEAPTEAKPHDIPMSYWSNFAVDGGLQGLEKLVETPAK